MALSNQTKAIIAIGAIVAIAAVATKAIKATTAGAVKEGTKAAADHVLTQIIDRSFR